MWDVEELEHSTKDLRDDELAKNPVCGAACDATVAACFRGKETNWKRTNSAKYWAAFLREGMTLTLTGNELAMTVEMDVPKATLERNTGSARVLAQRNTLRPKPEMTQPKMMVRRGRLVASLRNPTNGEKMKVQPKVSSMKTLCVSAGVVSPMMSRR